MEKGARRGAAHAAGVADTTPEERWLTAVLPFVRDHVPPAPSRVLEIGCGTLGGFVPTLNAEGYATVGVDPEAPEGPAYRRVEFERYELGQPVDVIVACTSLHHVADLGQVLDRVVESLVPGGQVIVVEWAHELFDEGTARWCFDRLTDPDREHGWLQHHRVAWQASGLGWEAYLDTWAHDEHLHAGDTILATVQDRFESLVLIRAPYFFPELDNTTEADEQAAIDAGLIRPAGIRYVGRRR